jgi:hypothetical protein
MTPEMDFRCLLVCSDATVYSTMMRVLHDFSIAVEHCLLSSRGLKVLEKENLDLVGIDCNGDIYTDESRFGPIDYGRGVSARSVLSHSNGGTQTA